MTTSVPAKPAAPTPGSSSGRSPVGLLRLFTAAFALVGLLLMSGAGAVSAQSATDDPAQSEAGEAVFSGSCAGCHGASGEGSATGRPLTGIASQQPDRLIHIASVTDGKGGMPAFGEQLSADEIDAAISYVRLAFLAEEGPDELPATGNSNSAALAGFGLLAIGFSLQQFSKRRSPVLS